MRFLFAILLFFLGCAPLPPVKKAYPGTRVVLPTGETGYSIRCDNENMNACYEGAGATCPYGYEIQNQNKEEGYASTGSSFATETIGFGSSRSTTTTEKGLIILCKDMVRVEVEHSADDAEYAKAQQERKKLLAQQMTLARAGLVAGGVILFILIVAADP